jgi:hypothetical protein
MKCKTDRKMPYYNDPNPKTVKRKISVANPHSAFEKRQKEIAKKKKKEAKRLQKAGVDDSDQQGVRPTSENDDKAT